LGLDKGRHPSSHKASPRQAEADPTSPRQTEADPEIKAYELDFKRSLLSEGPAERDFTSCFYKLKSSTSGSKIKKCFLF